MRERLLKLLERWAEREIIRCNGRALIIPELTYRWHCDKLGRFHRISEGVCWEKMTARRESSELDDFGVAFRSLAEIEQALIIVDHLGDKTEWEEAIAYFGISSRKSATLLRTAWVKLTWACIKRGLIRSSSWKASRELPSS